MPMMSVMFIRQPATSLVMTAVPKASENSKGFKQFISKVMNIFKKPSSTKKNTHISSLQAELEHFTTHTKVSNRIIDIYKSTTPPPKNITARDERYNTIEICYKKPDILPEISAEKIFDSIFKPSERQSDLAKCIIGAREETAKNT
ncbi:hypothetical protein ASE93_18170 [Serratia sp. Leaf50]|nr:hypothetical protein ASE93_18170 [Serratia sp. Leaf50]